MRLGTMLLGALKPGQEHPEASVNARMHDRLSHLEEIKTSIAIDGLLQPLLCWHDTEGTGEHWIVDGSRRLLSINALHDEGLPIPGLDFGAIPVWIFEGGTLAEALAKSIAGFTTTLPPHPVDQFEAFAKLRQSMPGISLDGAADKIAARYGTTPALVMRRLALGSCAEVVRDALRKDEIDFDTAKAFTLERDPEKQAKLFAALRKKKNLSAYTVRKEIAGDARDVPKLLGLVGISNFEVAGGVIVRDLFTDGGKGDSVTDMALLQKMAGERVEEIKKGFIADNWQWAATVDELPGNWHFDWVRPKIAKTKATEALKEKAGVVLFINDDGSLSYEYGVQKPDEPAKKTAKPKADKKPKAEGEPEEPKMPVNVQRALVRQASQGVSTALATAPDRVLMAALLAAIQAGGKGPITIEARGLQIRESGMSTHTASFAKTFKKLMGADKATWGKVLAQTVAQAVDLGLLGEPEPMADDGVKALLAELKASNVAHAMGAAFDAKAYFEGVPKAIALEAVREALGADAIAAGMSKADLVKLCTVECVKAGWLPPELRAPGYAGPNKKKKG